MGWDRGFTSSNGVLKNSESGFGGVEPSFQDGRSLGSSSLSVEQESQDSSSPSLEQQQSQDSSFGTISNGQTGSTNGSRHQGDQSSNLSSFTPRETFQLPSSMPKSYYLGHHAAGLQKMRKMVSNVSLVVECRDYRIPVSSRNPLLEKALSDVPRIVVYTHADLGRASVLPTGKQDRSSSAFKDDQRRESCLREFDNTLAVHFVSNPRSRSGYLQRQHQDEISALYKTMRNFATATFDVTGKNTLITGVPNVGKSTLLNALRDRYAHTTTSSKRPSKAKVAQTGGQPGVTRKIGTAVKILDGNDGEGASSLYVLDTPGVFMPYVPDSATFLKLALCGCVKENLVPPLILADYLLFRLNLIDPAFYTQHTAEQPTNDIMAVLGAITKRTGRGLVKLRADSLEGASFDDPLDEIYGAKARVPRPKTQVDYEAVATWMIQQWRAGKFGHIVLDDVDGDELRMLQRDGAKVAVSQSQALRMERDRRRAAARVKKEKASS